VHASGVFGAGGSPILRLACHRSVAPARGVRHINCSDWLRYARSEETDDGGCGRSRTSLCFAAPVHPCTLAAHAHPCASRHRYIPVHWDSSSLCPRPLWVAGCAGAVLHRFAVLGSNPGGFCRTTLHHTYQWTQKGGLWYVAVEAVCCDPVSAVFPGNGKNTGKFSLSPLLYL
jgi:hypothetical protein